MVMWNILPENQRKRYQKLITSFASLSEAFNQKVETDENGNSVKSQVAPIVNSKFQETVFQRSFHATGEDTSNTSYDASLILENGQKFLIGLKSFGIESGDQKIAQFKKQQTSSGWLSIFAKIAENAKGKSKKEIDEVNEQLYLELATKISKLRNARIKSSKAGLKGFEVDEADENIEAVYHYLMPSKAGANSKITVGETPYYEIDIDNLTVKGCTGKGNPTNFYFTDGQHDYKYTSADSQLYMSFARTPQLDGIWDVHYLEDAINFFEEMSNSNPLNIISQIPHSLPDKSIYRNKDKVISSVSWMIKIEPASSFNSFMSRGKNGSKDLESILKKINRNFSNIPNIDNVILKLNNWKDNYSEQDYTENREAVMFSISQLSCPELYKYAQNRLYRNADEIYIRIPESVKFHQKYPDFFGFEYGKLKQILNSKGKHVWKYDKPHGKELSFELVLLPGNKSLNAKLTDQDSGKAIQSVDNQGILGKAILRNVFQLKEREPLTYERLDELEINSIRFSKFESGKIGMEFINIDTENLPEDFWGSTDLS